VIADEALKVFGHRCAEFETDDGAAAAALQHCLVEAHEIFGFFGDFDVAVAQDAEEAAGRDRVTRE